MLEVDEHSADGRIFTTFIPCEITGKYAEESSVTIEPGDVLHLVGKWKYKSTVDQKSGAKVSKPVVSAWGIQQRQPATTAPGGVADSTSDGAPIAGKPARPAQRQTGVAR